MKKCKLIVLLILLLMQADLSATVLKKLDIPQMTAKADLIVRGKVLQTTSATDTAESRFPYTYTKIKVEQTIKGTAEDTISVRRIAGSKNGIAIKIPGMPELQEGQSVLLFLKKDKDVFVIVGMAQGVYRIQTQSGLEIAKQNMFGAAVYDGKQLAGSTKTPNGILYKELLKQIRLVLEKEAK